MCCATCNRYRSSSSSSSSSSLSLNTHAIPMPNLHISNPGVQGQRSDRGLAYLSLARLGLAAGPSLWRGVPTLWHSVREVVKDGLAEDRQEFCPQSLACLEVGCAGPSMGLGWVDLGWFGGRLGGDACSKCS